MDCLLQFENILQEEGPQRNQNDTTSFPSSVCVSSLETNSHCKSHKQSHLEGLSHSTTVTSESRLRGPSCPPWLGALKLVCVWLGPQLLPRQAVQRQRAHIPAGPNQRADALAPLRLSAGTQHCGSDRGSTAHSAIFLDRMTQRGKTEFISDLPPFPRLCVPTTHVSGF